jgi:hypothetical protein
VAWASRGTWKRGLRGELHLEDRSAGFAPSGGAE